MTYSTRRPVVGYPGRLLVPNLGGLHPVSTAATSLNTLAANQAYYLPFMAPYDTGVATMSFFCGAGTNNHDLGIYDAAGNRLTSRGATATSAGAINTWTLGTPQAVTAGTLYYAAFGLVSAVPTIASWAASIRTVTLGIFTQGTAVALPSTATFAQASTATIMPILSLTFTT